MKSVPCATADLLRPHAAVLSTQRLVSMMEQNVSRAAPPAAQTALQLPVPELREDPPRWYAERQRQNAPTKREQMRYLFEVTAPAERGSDFGSEVRLRWWLRGIYG